jgi:hypothetical protein
MKFPLPFESKWIEKLHNCDLCSGVWVYCVLAVLFGVDIVQDIFGRTVAIAGALVTGAVSSFVVHIFSLGWKTRFEVIVI